MRGQHRLVREQHHRIRIIPARAGPTPCSPTARTPATDHPRSCGANCGGYGGDDACDGSSPLVRGQRYHQNQKSAQRRIIPARAGPTYGSHVEMVEPADHPRSCGANFPWRQWFRRQDGSSPLVRGQPMAEIERQAAMRIIPARAGPTSAMGSGACATPDHPRSCGANTRRRWMTPASSGSSPLVRGQRFY